ncbi:hypothetical protein SAMN06265337_0677 [Hymenobacter gelipurpurascens]|uniref:SpoIIAA-like n=1 Tax=Hymenobacter gelipurpurascens TaxID=89968 RepID=A0A212T8W8_9BACT|nr:hypothetical protein [Hymenobacter gelipurpurascens]SNC62469.1 hypothetical protein SAMN06265337_0677 [Hymenobacter gelipurpurascens]
MQTVLRNGFGNVYMTTEYDAVNKWVYNNWIGHQTLSGVMVGADACLQPLKEHACQFLLNDNRHVIGPWDHAVQWIVAEWAPRAIAQGLTHFAHVVSAKSLAALSAESMHIGIGGRLQMRMFDDITDARAWLHEAQNSQQPHK